MNPIHELIQDAKALALFKDWLGDGMLPVAQTLADHRSLACLRGNEGMECPHHKAARWWETYKNPVAAAIRQQLDVKQQLARSTPLEAELKMCRICGCCMALKIWVPVNYIAAHTSKEQIEKYPSFCWIRQEIQNYV